MTDKREAILDYLDKDYEALVKYPRAFTGSSFNLLLENAQLSNRALRNQVEKHDEGGIGFYGNLTRGQKVCKCGLIGCPTINEVFSDFGLSE